jgi:hypothetical protein
VGASSLLLRCGIAYIDQRCVAINAAMDGRQSLADAGKALLFARQIRKKHWLAVSIWAARRVWNWQMLSEPRFCSGTV